MKIEVISRSELILEFEKPGPRATVYKGIAFDMPLKRMPRRGVLMVNSTAFIAEQQGKQC